MASPPRSPSPWSPKIKKGGFYIPPGGHPILFGGETSPQHHRMPAHTRFQSPAHPRSRSPHASTSRLHESALPRFWSAVPRTTTPAGNLRLYHPLGDIAAQQSALDPLMLNSKFQFPSPPPTPSHRSPPRKNESGNLEFVRSQSQVQLKPLFVPC